MAYTDEDGYFFFVDRKSDFIRRRGENISSFEVEKVVNGHDDVLESAAYALPSELGEDEVTVAVVLQPGARLTPQALVRHCEARMASFMVPRFVRFVGAFPKTGTERTMKYELKAQGRHPGHVGSRGGRRGGKRLAERSKERDQRRGLCRVFLDMTGVA